MQTLKMMQWLMGRHDRSRLIMIWGV